MKSLLLILIVLISACSTQQERTLIGTWKSDKELSLKNIDNEKVNPALKKYIEENFGKLHVQFKENKAGVYFDDPNKISWISYKVISKSNDKIVIHIDDKNNIQPINEYYWHGECVYLLINNIKEYFCRE